VRIGLISDTHGLLRPEALHLLAGCKHIIHAGDIGDAAILESLGELAPVTAVRGNNDVGAWARRIPETTALRSGKARIYVIHDLSRIELDPAAHGYQAVISGHSHKPRTELKNGVLYVNPGSAGPRRFTLPISLGFLEVSGARVKADLVELKAPGTMRG
jgi:uncharacterized protein